MNTESTIRIIWWLCNLQGNYK